MQKENEITHKECTRYMFIKQQLFQTLSKTSELLVIQRLFGDTQTQ